MKRQNILVWLFFCGFWLLASSEYHVYQNRFSNRTEIKDRSGRTKWYLRENRFTGKTDIKTRDGERFGVITRNKIMDRSEIRDDDGQGRWYLRKNPFTNRIDVKTMDGRKEWEVRCNRFLDRLEVEKVKQGQGYYFPVALCCHIFQIGQKLCPYIRNYEKFKESCTGLSRFLSDSDPILFAFVRLRYSSFVILCLFNTSGNREGCLQSR